MRKILHEIGVAARAIFVPCPNAYKPRNLQEKLADMIKVDRTKYFFQQRKEKRISIYKQKEVQIRTGNLENTKNY